MHSATAARNPHGVVSSATASCGPVVPAVPVRKYVLSFPFELALLGATNWQVLSAVARTNHDETARYFRQRAVAGGVVGKTCAGAPTFVHRFGSSLNLHPDQHVGHLRWDVR